MLITFFNKSIRLWFGNVVSDGADWHHIAKWQTNGFIEIRMTSPTQPGSCLQTQGDSFNSEP